MEQFTPPKLIWTDADFQQMSWHDCRLHGVAIFDDCNPHLHQLRLDIDYIFEWRGFGDAAAQESGFWISPATLVFEPQSYHIDLLGPCGDWISELAREDGGSFVQWIVSLNTGGSFTVRAPGFTQYIRCAPVFVRTPDQSLESTQRGGISFEVPSNQT